MDRYYDRSGEVIDVWRFNELFANRDYQVLRQEQIGEYIVSTIWLGINHQFGEGSPLIFESMVFRGKDGGIEDYTDLASRRYSTEEQALQGHAEMVQAWGEVVEA